ncbi:MAG: hypothetical protein FWJ87_16605, partial [Micromonosporaceae bacterium]
MTTTPTVARKARAAISEKTLRNDRWWLVPALTVAGLSAWLIYGLVRVFWQDHYWVAEHHYLTPFYSPCISTGCIPESAHFGRFLPDHPLVPYAALS